MATISEKERRNTSSIPILLNMVLGQLNTTFSDTGGLKAFIAPTAPSTSIPLGKGDCEA